MNTFRLNSILIGILFSILIGCSSEEKDPLKVDVSDVKVELNFSYMYQDIHAVDTNSIKSFNDKMQNDYGSAWQHYAGGVLRLGDVHDPAFPQRIVQFFRYPFVQPAMDAVDSVFGDMSKYENDFTDAFKHVKYYYKDLEPPKIIFTNTFFNYSAVALEDAVMIGLDFHLGKDNWLVKSLPPQQFFDYIKFEMDSKYLVLNAMLIWFESNYLPNKEFEEYLDALIHYGKLMYAMDAFMPDMPDHVKMKYTKDEMEWCVSNEHKIWLTLVDRSVIRSKDKRLIDDYFKEGPFTPGLTDEDTPDRIGVFIGWSIVRDYMAENPDKNIVDLLENTNKQEILRAYKQGE